MQIDMFNFIRKINGIFGTGKAGARHLQDVINLILPTP
ncbi:uncharacterized protein G2W53_035173 [Senna tora]|uniref:Uncharacterized protein n=1 Tax=Senna tora TaxID=362788 RepID=A0A834W3V0_9FABA|nr:uncharacterized protein G2W53_035173 [Senna tora]